MWFLTSAGGQSAGRPLRWVHLPDRQDQHKNTHRRKMREGERGGVRGGKAAKAEVYFRRRAPLKSSDVIPPPCSAAHPVWPAVASPPRWNLAAFPSITAPRCAPEPQSRPPLLSSHLLSSPSLLRSSSSSGKSSGTTTGGSTESSSSGGGRRDEGGRGRGLWRER